VVLFSKFDKSYVNIPVRKFLAASMAIVVVLLVACSNSGDDEPGTAHTPPGPAPTEGLSTGVEKSEGAEADVSPADSDSAQPTVAAEEKVPSALPIAPVFSVSTVDGETIRLEEILGTVPVYLLFIPGIVDELDRSQMIRIQSQHAAFERLGARVVVVAADLPAEILQMRDELGLEFALISDPLHNVASDWKVFDLENDGKVTPASFVFDAHGNLVARLISAEPGDRPTVEEVLNIIEESLSVGAA
jgi:peroxiredoxin